MVRGRSTIATFYFAQPLTHGSRVVLDAAAAQHARVRRLELGEPLCLTDGKGAIARGTLARLARSELEVDVGEVERRSAPSLVHLLVPVSDRERMLWVAEKACELGVSTWQSVTFARSRSVSPRGEGAAFLEKVQARMVSALEQSAGAWLPEILAEIDVPAALRSNATAVRLLLDGGGAAILSYPMKAPVAIALGPEGGVTSEERESFLASGWLPTSLGATTLRFETAAVASTAIVRAALQATPEG